VNHNHKDVPRPVRPTDALVIFTELLFNISQVVATFFESLMELSIYHANRTTKVNKIWDEFAQDLETLQEDTDGAN
jgi:hypothetical protein